MGLFTSKKKLFAYIENNQVQKLKKALTSPGLVNLKDKYGNTLLIHSIIHNKIDIVDILLAAGADPGICNEILQNNSYSYHFAASGNHHEIVKRLLEHGANPNVEDIKALTPLHRGCKFGSCKSVLHLLSRGANVNAITVFNTQPLHYAAERGYTNIVIPLLEHGASIDGIEDDAKPPMYWAVKGLHLETARVLYTRGAVSDFLHLTELQKNILAGKALTFREKDINKVDIFGRTILFYAVSAREDHLVQKIIDMGCDTEIRDIYEMKAEAYSF